MHNLIMPFCKICNNLIFFYVEIKISPLKAEDDTV